MLILSFITIFSIHRVFHNNPNSIFLPIEDEACSDLAKAKKSEMRLLNLILLSKE